MKAVLAPTAAIQSRTADPVLNDLHHSPQGGSHRTDTIFYTLAEAKIVVESWRRHFNTVRPHRSLGYKPPAPEVFVPP